MNNISVFCADVGSIKANNFGWAAILSHGESLQGNDIGEFSEKISEEIANKRKVALGFECPLFIPIRDDPLLINGARKGEGNRPWSAGAGTAALATGLVEVLWVMNRVSGILGYPPKFETVWKAFLSEESIFLWEAFVSSKAKGKGHSDDANIAVQKFIASMPDPSSVDAIEPENVLSLVGAAALRAGWANDIAVLSQQCTVIKA